MMRLACVLSLALSKRVSVFAERNLSFEMNHYTELKIQDFTKTLAKDGSNDS